MWCDNFDGDLYKLVPQARDALALMADVTLWTYGSVWTDGRLNHPSVWNSYIGSVAFFGLHDHDFNPGANYTTEPLIECTFEEACRSGWVQSWTLILRGHPLINFGHGDMRLPFDALLWHARGLRRIADDEVVAYQHLVAGILKHSAMMLERTIYYHPATERGHGPATEGGGGRHAQPGI